MTSTQLFFLQLLSDHLHNRASVPTADVDWDKLLDYAQRHQVQGIVYVQCRAFLESKPEYVEIANKLRTAHSAALYYAVNRQAETAGLRAALNAEGIENFIIKGAEVAQFYPIPALRTMGDLDLVVHADARERAHEIMLERGFRNVAKDPDREWQYYKNRLEYELHDRLVYYEAVNIDAHERYFNDFWPYVKDGELDWSFHFMFLLLHLRKHMMNAGTGFRHFMDLAVVARGAADRLDWPWIERELERLGLLRFAGVCFAFIERWFSLPSPIKAEPLDEAFYLAATEKIFEDGVFGFDNRANEKNRTVHELRRLRLPRLLSMAVLLIKRLFPSVKTMAKSEPYAFLRRRPWLLPFAWLYRFGRTLFTKGKWKHNTKQLKDVFVEKKSIDAYTATLKQWGL